MGLLFFKFKERSDCMDNKLTDTEIQEMLKKYPLGNIDSPIDLRDYTYNMISEVSNVEIPNEFELKYQFEAKNQGQIGACVNHAISSTKEMIDNVSEYYSQWWLHALRSDSDFQGKGAIIREELKHLVNDGIVPLKLFNVPEDYSQIKTTLENKYNKESLLEEAAKHKSTGYINLNNDEIKKYLYSEKKPIIVAVKVYQNFYEAPYNNGIIPSVPIGSYYGNHAMAIVGYKNNILKILNSWGQWGGKNGYLYLDINNTIIKELWGLTDKPIDKPPVKTYKVGWDKDPSTGKWIFSEDGETLVKDAWKEIKNTWYYFKDIYALDGEWIKYKDKWYYLEKGSCAMATDKWIEGNDKWYRVNKDGAMLTGWYQDVKLKWYYLDIEKGYCYTNCTILIDGKSYRFDSNGVWIENTRLKGIDISNNNGNIDFNKVKAGGVEVVYIKATEGTTFVDSYLNTNYCGAKQVGLKTGFYHFLVGTSSPESQATNFYYQIKDKQNDLKPCLDVEAAFDGLMDYVLRFIDKFKQLSGMDVCIYTYTGFMSNLDNRLFDYVLWEANYNNDPWNLPGNSICSTVVGHQYTDKGKINGINTNVDVNEFTQDILI